MSFIQEQFGVLWLKSFINLSQTLPNGILYALSDLFVPLIIRYNPSSRAMRKNLSVVYDGDVDHIDRDLKALAKNTLRTYIDLFDAIKVGGLDNFHSICELKPWVIQSLKAVSAQGKGIVLAGAHTCGFDFGLVAIGRAFPEAIILVNANPKGKMGVMHRMRKRLNLNVTPISPQSLRQAIHHLKNGGMVIIAGDMPAADGESVDFFGKPAKLGVGYVRLAQMTGSTIGVVYTYRHAGGGYGTSFKFVPRPNGNGDRGDEIRLWAGEVLSVLEGFIKVHPGNWLMPFALWEGKIP